MVRDAEIIDGEKFNPQEERHSIESDFNNLTEHDKLDTANFLIWSLNTHLGIFARN